MASELNPEVQRALAALSAVLERGFRARVGRRLRDKGMPVGEIAEVLDVTRASVYRKRLGRRPTPTPVPSRTTWTGGRKTKRNGS